MFEFFASLRASLVVGQANKHFRNQRYRDALARAEHALGLGLNENFALLCLLIAGKSRVHLGDVDRAEDELRRARELIAPRLAAQPDSPHVQNIVEDIERYLNTIEKHRRGETQADD